MSFQADRRDFLKGTSLGLVGGALGGASGCRPAASVVPSASNAPAAPANLAASTAQRYDDWASIRDQFSLSREYIHLALLYLASHPKPVRDAIERHRQGLDEDPVGYHHANYEKEELGAREAAARYFHVQADEIALTDSTTMGLGLVYGALVLKPGQEIVSTAHDHYSTQESLRLRAERNGASVRRIKLYEKLDGVSEDEIVGSVVKALTPKTRLVAVTWVHSSTGLKLPVRKIADALAEANAKRDEGDRVLLSVDGVHAVGVEKESVADLHCDLLIAGCHKWLFGPRGTGFVWGSPAAWKAVQPVIPSFSKAYGRWMEGVLPNDVPRAQLVSPGGFHSFEHRWSLRHAFAFHEQIGRERITTHIHDLNRHCKEELRKMPQVTLHTPMGESLSSGLVCFEVKGVPADDVVKRLQERKIIASVTPYATKYARFSTALLNTTADIETALGAVRALG
ncbi:MAG TPA: aminotransferase class V-fold PLP-dependent enzyme [Polyangiaceae bacterium]|nr:aminotransferase class V-fold PLP-dependent enzyme [Polyangiaceae bacterium]